MRRSGFKNRVFMRIMPFFAALLLACASATPAFANADLASFENIMFQAGARTPVDEAPSPEAAAFMESVGVLSGVPKPAESTFDAIRTIVGAAPKDTAVTIAVYAPGAQPGEYEQRQRYELVVGPSGVFSKTIDMELGQNFLYVAFERGGQRAVKTALINRKNIEIKKELEQGGNLLQVNIAKP